MANEMLGTVLVVILATALFYALGVIFSALAGYTLEFWMNRDGGVPLVDVPLYHPGVVIASLLLGEIIVPAAAITFLCGFIL